MEKFTPRVNVTNVTSITAGRHILYKWMIVLDNGNRVYVRKHTSRHGSLGYIEEWLIDQGYILGKDALAECVEVLES